MSIGLWHTAPYLSVSWSLSVKNLLFHFIIHRNHLCSAPAKLFNWNSHFSCLFMSPWRFFYITDALHLLWQRLICGNTVKCLCLDSFETRMWTRRCKATCLSASLWRSELLGGRRWSHLFSVFQKWWTTPSVCRSYKRSWRSFLLSTTRSSSTSSHTWTGKDLRPAATEKSSGCRGALWL